MRRAAEQALAQAAPTEAARWYCVALDLVNDPQLEVELLVLAGKAEFLAGLRSGRDTLLEPARRADQIGDLDLMCDALRLSHRRSSSEVNADVDVEMHHATAPTASCRPKRANASNRSTPRF